MTQPAHTQLELNLTRVLGAFVRNSTTTPMPCPGISPRRRLVTIGRPKTGENRVVLGRSCLPPNDRE